VNAHPVDLTIAQAGAALRSGQLSAVSLTEAHLARIESRNPSIGAFVHVATEAALKAAHAADAAIVAGATPGPLHGIPFAIKDIIDIADWPVRWGSQLQQERIATDTAPAVKAMLAGGAIPLGLVASYELASVGPDLHSLYPQPRNPWNRAHITGGSSSGAAAAVAAGMVRLALGTDTGGSIRSPSAYCGTVGLKPTFGAVPMDHVMPLAASLDHVGPIARTVPEVAAAFAVLTNQTMPCSTDVSGIRVAYARNWCHDDLADARLLPLMDDAASVLSLCGVTLTLHDLSDYAGIEAAASRIIHAEQFATHGAAVKANPGSVGPMATHSILTGASVSAEQLRQARRVAAAFRAELETLLREHDVLILPTTMTPALTFTRFAGRRSVWTAMRTIPFNVTGHPALSVPMGVVDGLPFGLQIVGRHGDEATVLCIGAAFEAATDYATLSPNFT